MSGSGVTKNLFGRSLSGIAALGAGSAGRFILHFIALIILARRLPPADFGLVSAITVFLGIGDILVTIGLGAAIVQRRTLTDDHIRTACSITLLIGLALTLLTFWGAEQVAWMFRMERLTVFVQVASVTFLIRSTAVVAESLMLREKRFGRLAMVVLTANACGLVLVAIPMALAGFGPWSLVAGNLTIATVTALGQIHAAPHPKRPLFKWRAARDLLYYGAGNSLARISHTLSVQCDNLVVGRLLGAEALGLYGRAYQIMSFPAILLGDAIHQVFFPVFAEVQDDRRRLAEGLFVSIGAVAAIVGPTAVMVAILAPEMVVLVLGANWLAIVLPLQIMAGGMVFRVGFKISDSLVKAMGVEYWRALIVTIYAATVLGGALTGALLWGLPGVAVGTLVALGVDYGLMGLFAARLAGLPVRRFLKAHAWGVILSLTAGAVAWPVAGWLRSAGWTGPAVMAATGLAAGSVLLLCIRIGGARCLGPAGQAAIDRMFALMPRLAPARRLLFGLS